MTTEAEAIAFLIKTGQIKDAPKTNKSTAAPIEEDKE
jgi:hypothetical protein